MSWAGIALAQLARATGIGRYKTGRVRDRRLDPERDRTTTGFGGYTFGETAGLADHKSTEHNIDVAAFFRLIQTLTGQRVWRDRARPRLGVRRAGSGTTRTASSGPAPTTAARSTSSDTQLPARRPDLVLAGRRRRARTRAALDWAATNLATTDTPQRLNSALTGNQKVTGVAFGSGSLKADPTVPIDQWNPKPDSGAVWFEGTAQLALALADRNRKGDQAAAQALLDAVIWAQGELGVDQTFGGKRIDGGIVAASSPMQHRLRLRLLPEPARRGDVVVRDRRDPRQPYVFD